MADKLTPETLHMGGDAYIDKLERLVLAAYRILANGMAGSAWMDWKMRAQGLMGKKLILDSYDEAGRALPFDHIKEGISDMPRVLARDTGWRPRSETADD